MCDRCANIDYPIGDSIWLPCGGPADRYTSRRRGVLPPITPNSSHSDHDYDRQTKINDLMSIIRRQRDEISSLKVKAAPRDDSRESFEGVE